ncbi:MAG: hypothetical protein IAI48_11415 [Candidatus Eremiobacteraeota bacterium]|nr:hypothetical protein [Candidatus Eremiobacteraeota bacterium]
MAEFSRKADESGDTGKVEAQIDVRLGDELVTSFAGAPGPTRIVVSEARRLDDARRIAIALGIVSPVRTALMVDRSWRSASVKMLQSAGRRVDDVIDCSSGYGRATMSIDPMLCGRFSGRHRSMRGDAIEVSARIVNENPDTRIVSDLASRLVETMDYENRWSFSRAYRWSSLRRDFRDPSDFIAQPVWADRVIDRKFEPLCLLETARIIAPTPLDDELAPATKFGFIVDGGWDPVVDGFVRRIASNALAGSYLAIERTVRAADEEGWSGCVSVGINLHERLTRGILFGQQDDLSVYDEIRRLPAEELRRVGMTGDFNVRMRKLGDAKYGIAFDRQSIEIVAIEGLADRLIDRYRFGLVGNEPKRRTWRPLRAMARSLGL